MTRIAVDVQQSGIYTREVLQGVMQYALMHSDWEFLMPPMYWRTSSKPFWNQADGIITMFHTPEDVRRLRRTAVPVVNASRTMSVEQLQKLNVFSVLPSDADVGRLAFSYLYERQFRSFGFCGHPEAEWSLLRQRAFLTACQEKNVECSFTVDSNQVSRSWVASLPRPCAILAANDYFGWLCIDACRANGIAVPEEIAVLGVDNDEMLGNLVRPTLSSVDLDAERIGFESARMLHQLLDKKPLEKQTVELPPVGVVTRHSTDVLSIEDPAVAEAARFIREHANEPISVDDVLNAVAMSRRNLERRFKKTMNRSLLDEIIRVRIDRACRLLRETGLDMERIARQCGFNSHIRFTTVFHNVVKCTPTAYRKAHRMEVD